MRRFIATTADTIAAILGLSPDGRIVTGLAALRLRGVYVARTLLVRLAGRVPARLPVVNVCHARPADPGAAGVLGHHCLSTPWSRRWRRPVRSGASLRGF